MLPSVEILLVDPLSQQCNFSGQSCVCCAGCLDGIGGLSHQGVPNTTGVMAWSHARPMIVRNSDGVALRSRSATNGASASSWSSAIGQTVHIGLGTGSAIRITMPVEGGAIAAAAPAF
jgi:hypothetical protein